jgi:hypothetical protein
MTSPSLVEFLTARLAEAQIVAVESQRDPWRVGHKSSCDWWGDMPGYCSCDATARALADVAAKRAVVEFAASLIANGEDSEPWAGEEVLARLGTEFADHPDYDATWAP